MKALTPYERQVVADTFKKAKIIFEGNRYQYICTALRCTLPFNYWEASEEYQGYKLAKAIVEERLEGQLSLESWLKKRGFPILLIRLQSWSRSSVTTGCNGWTY